jgi:hypothetical protein
VAIEVSRRRLLQAGAALGVVGAAGVGIVELGGRGRGGNVPAPAEGTHHPVRMAMHIHSSFSEGPATMMAHLAQAERHGVDVLWWTDHDFRMEGYGYTRTIACDGTDEGQQVSWKPVQMELGKVEATGREFLPAPGTDHQNALRIGAKSVDIAWGSIAMKALTGNLLYNTNLADTTMTVEMLAEHVSDNATAFMQIRSSYRPATHGRPAGNYVLHYRVGPTAMRVLEKPLRGVVQVKATGSWQKLTIDPVADMKLFWPDIQARDSALYDLRFGVRVRNGASADAWFRNVTFTRARYKDPLQWGPDLQRELTAFYAPRYRNVVVYPATEVSLVRHINVFGSDPELFRYTGPAVKDGSPEALQAMVQWYRSRGLVVQYNHPSPTSGAELVAHAGFGCELMEVGRDSHYKKDRTGKNTTLGNRIDMFDAAARNAIFLTATGVTDDHVGSDWAQPGDGAQRYVTSVWSTSTERAELCTALSAGRAWWHDLLLWPAGQLDLFVDRIPAMGQAWRTDRKSAQVTILARGLPADAHVHVIVGKCDRGETTPAITDKTLSPGSFRSGGHEVTLHRDGGRYLRVEVHDSDDRVIGFSNAFWMLPTNHSADIPAGRKLQIQPS